MNMFLDATNDNVTKAISLCECASKCQIYYEGYSNAFVTYSLLLVKVVTH